MCIHVPHFFRSVWSAPVQYYCHIKMSICEQFCDLKATINKQRDIQFCAQLRSKEIRLKFPNREPVDYSKRKRNSCNKSVVCVCVIEIRKDSIGAIFLLLLLLIFKFTSVYIDWQTIQMPITHKACLPLVRLGEPSFMTKANCQFDIPASHLVQLRRNFISIPNRSTLIK